LHEAKGVVCAEIQSQDLVSSTHSTSCRIKFYAGNAVVEIQSSNSFMVFTTDSIDDMLALKRGAHSCIKKMRKTVK